jgi:hypothetical protein
MRPDLIAPAVVAVSAALMVVLLRRRLPPRTAIVVLTLAAVSAAATVVWALALLVFGALLGVAGVTPHLAWCRDALLGGHGAPPLVGVAAGALLAVGATRVVLFDLRWRRSLDRHRHGGELQVLEVNERVAYSVPGPTGTVVLSRGLLRVLGPSERAAVMAHERCHLERRHHRYLRLAGLSAAAVPGLGTLARHVRVATEREADEAAADAVGDRRTVARAIAAAIGSPVPFSAAAAGEHAVTERIHSLLYPNPVAWLTVAAVMTGVAGALVTISSSTVQLHHLLLFVGHVCGLG